MKGQGNKEKCDKSETKVLLVKERKVQLNLTIMVLSVYREVILLEDKNHFDNKWCKS